MDQYSCPYCTQQIPTHTKKCSYCHEWLAPGRWDKRNPEIRWTWIAIVALITFFGIQFYQDKFSQVAPKQALQQFVKGTSKIAVLSDKIIKNGQRLYIAGELKNDESVNWENVYITANFFNKAGEKIDTSYDSLDVFMHLLEQGTSTGAFGKHIDTNLIYKYQKAGNQYIYTHKNII